jgi:hypothetical protein
MINVKTRRRRLTEEAVAKQFGVFAPFPSTKVQDRWIKWQRRDEWARNTDDVEWAREVRPELIRAEEALVARRCRRRDRLKLPSGYLSWQHIGAFCTYYNSVECQRAALDAVLAERGRKTACVSNPEVNL